MEPKISEIRERAESAKAGDALAMIDLLQEDIPYLLGLIEEAKNILKRPDLATVSYNPDLRGVVAAWLEKVRR